MFCSTSSYWVFSSLHRSFWLHCSSHKLWVDFSCLYWSKWMDIKAQLCISNVTMDSVKWTHDRCVMRTEIVEAFYVCLSIYVLINAPHSRIRWFVSTPYTLAQIVIMNILRKIYCSLVYYGVSLRRKEKLRKDPLIKTLYLIIFTAWSALQQASTIILLP